MCGSSHRTTLWTGKYMKLLAFLAIMSKPGSGTVFDPTTIRVTVPVVLDDSLPGKPLQKSVRGLYYRCRKEKTNALPTHREPSPDPR